MEGWGGGKVEVRSQLYPRGKSSRYPLNRRLDGPQSQSGRFGGTEKTFPSARIRNPDRQARSLVTVQTTLLRLRVLM